MPFRGPQRQKRPAAAKAEPAKPLEEGFEVSRTSAFSSPLLLGFDHLERLLERTAKTAGDGYPPYNIEEIGPERLRITLAVAGFNREELSVTIEENQLVIRGRQADSSDKTFLYRGIAARQFQRAFVLAEGIEVTMAELENGLLSIDLARPQAAAVVRTVEIKTSSSGSVPKRGA